MMFDEYFSLGVISKAFSFKGEVIVRLDLNYPEIIESLPTIFIEKNNQLVPFQIETLDFQKNNFVRVKFKGIDSEEEAKKIVRSNLYLPDELLPKLSKDEFYHHEIIGFEIIDQDDKVLGKVTQVFDLPANPLIEILYEGKETLIPISLMETIDKANKKIYMLIPNGLLNV